MPTAPAPVGFIPSIPRPFVRILPFLEQDDAFGQPTIPSVQFTEFYCQSTGNNINAGSTTDANAIYTSTNGNWSTVTNIFTPTDGSDSVASGVSAGMFASVYVDGATTAVYIVLITNVVGGANGSITLSSTVIYGTAPTTSATARSIKVGGAWLGPNGAANFPFGLSGTIGVLVGLNSYHTRINLKNDQTYTMTAVLTVSSMGNSTLQGFTNTPGDGGKTTLTSNVTASSNFVTATATPSFIDLIFVSTGASGVSNCFDTSVTAIFIRCVFRGARLGGLNTSGGSAVVMFECEMYDCNKSNTAGAGGVRNGSSASVIICVNCYSHDHTSGSSCDAYVSQSNQGGLYLINCIADSVTGSGAQYIGAAFGFISVNCDYYNISGDAIKFANVTQGMFQLMINNNFVNIGGRAINNTVTAQSGILYNNGRSNTGIPDQLKSIIDTHTDIFYPLGVTPWNSPTTGDFSKVLAAAISSGRGQFTQTDGTNTGTVSYPDIGATQAQLATQGFSVPNTIQILSPGYLNHAYNWKFSLNYAATFTLQSGTLPTGLTLSQVDPNSVQIVGTPTVIATFVFTLRATVGTSFGDATYSLQVLDDPDEGTGGVGGG